MRGLLDPIKTSEPYTHEWTRTRPDYIVYRPSGLRDGYNDHVLIDIARCGDLVAVWTQGTREGAEDTRVVSARSHDGGSSWSDPQVLADNEGVAGQVAWAGFPVISASGRIYVFYNKNIGVRDGGHYFTGVLRCVYSDDDGRTWQRSVVAWPYPRTRFDHPDPAVPCKCVVWQRPIRDGRGRWVVGFSRWSSSAVFPPPVCGFHWDTSVELMRIDNLDQGPLPEALRITWLPTQKQPIRVACPIEPEHSRGYSLCEEPSMVRLPDGRLFMVMRTVTGRIWYTVSDDDGDSWRPPEVLRLADHGVEVRHPKSPCPLFALNDGRFLLAFHHHDGFHYGGSGPWDMQARRPVWITVGTFHAEAHQPIWFGRPKIFADTDGVAIGPDRVTGLAMYASMTEYRDHRIVWYPDRKYFVVGRAIPDAWLAA